MILLRPPNPWFSLWVPLIVLRKVLIQYTAGMFRCAVLLEVGCKHRPFNTWTIKHSSNTLTLVKWHHVHVRKIELQGQHRRGPITYIKTIYPPQGFWWSYPPSIPVLFDLIDVSFIVLLVSLSHSHRCVVMTLVNVLKQILDGLDAPTCLNTDVAIEQSRRYGL